MIYINFNVNDEVLVKLTPHGIDILEKQHWELMKHIPNPYPFKLKKDKNGYTSFQLWELMRYFGDYIGLGTALPFETGILISMKGN